jgi:hypothetical protein
LTVRLISVTTACQSRWQQFYYADSIFSMAHQRSLLSLESGSFILACIPGLADLATEASQVQQQTTSQPDQFSGDIVALALHPEKRGSQASTSIPALENVT